MLVLLKQVFESPPFLGRCTDPTSSSSAFSRVVRNVTFQNKRCFGRKWLLIAPLSPLSLLPPKKKVCMMRPHGADRASAKAVAGAASPDARIISHHAQLQCCEGSLLEDSINWFAALVCKARDLYGLHRRTVSREALHCSHAEGAQRIQESSLTTIVTADASKGAPICGAHC